MPAIAAAQSDQAGLARQSSALITMARTSALYPLMNGRTALLMLDDCDSLFTTRRIITTPPSKATTATTKTGNLTMERLKPQMYINCVIEKAPIPTKNQRVPLGIRKMSPSKEKINPSRKGNVAGVIGA